MKRIIRVKEKDGSSFICLLLVLADKMYCQGTRLKKLCSGLTASHTNKTSSSEFIWLALLVD